MKKDTPFIDLDAWECDGCHEARVPVVRVGEVVTWTLSDDDDDESINPESSCTACLCKTCLEKALALLQSGA